MDLFRIKLEEFSVPSEPLFYVADVPIISPFLTGVFITLLFAVFALVVSPKIKTDGPPTKVQTFLEMIYLTLFDLTTKISGDEKVARKIINIILAVMIYLILANTLLIVPGLSSLEYDGVPVFTTSTKDLNTTFGIALTIVLWTHVASIQKYNYNPFIHLYKFFNFDKVVDGFKEGIGKGLMGIINVFIGLLDVIGDFAKSLSLSLRLFGNMFAGEVLLALVVSAFAVVAPVFLMFYSVFAGVLQAIVFGALAASYFGTMLKE